MNLQVRFTVVASRVAFVSERCAEPYKRLREAKAGGIYEGDLTFALDRLDFSRSADKGRLTAGGEMALTDRD